LTVEVIERSESAVCGGEGRTWQARIGRAGTKRVIWGGNAKRSYEKRLRQVEVLLVRREGG
jgi:hypothetical protein